MVRTKDELIAARGKPNTGTPWGAPACMLASGRVDDALDMLVQHAGMQWQYNALFHFDLRRLDEQGRLLTDGAMPLLPRAFGGSPPSEKSTPAAAAAAAGVLSLRIGIEAEPAMLTWQAGEYLDDVLARGAEWVTARARAAIRHTRPQTLRQRPETVAPTDDVEVIPLELPEGPCAIVVSGGLLGREAVERIEKAVKGQQVGKGPVHVLLEAPHGMRVEVKPLVADVDRLRPILRERGYDVVPLLRRADLRTWLLSIGFKDTDRSGVVQRNSFETVINWRGTEEMETLPCEDSTIASVASCLGMQARAVRDAIQRHVQEQHPEHGTPDDHTTYNVSTDHNNALRAAGFNPEAMTTNQIVDASNRGLLPGFGPGWMTKVVEGRIVAEQRAVALDQRPVVVAGEVDFSALARR